jgi:protein TonB
MLNLQAQIARQTQAYQERPRKRFIGANAREYRFAQYEEDWRSKIERVGHRQLSGRGARQALRHAAADGDHPARRHGGFDRAGTVPRASRCLDQAAFRIVKMAAPFARVSAEIRKDTDLLVITRTCFFAQGDKVWTE